MPNIVATLQQRCGNLLIMSESVDVVRTLDTEVSATLIFDRVTTLWPRQQRLCDNVVTMSLCLLGLVPFSFTKNGFVVPYQDIAAETITFLDISFADANKFSSRTSDFFLCSYTRSFNRNIKGKIFFILPYYFFNHAGIALKLFS